MLKWMGSLVSPNRRTEAVPPPPPPPPMAGPSGRPAGIDHLVANRQVRPPALGETEDAYGSLMPVRRLDASTIPPNPPPALEPPSASPAAHTQPDEPPAAPAATAPETRPEVHQVEAAPPSPPPEEPVPPAKWETLHSMAHKARQQGDYATAAGWWWLMRVGFPNIFHGYADGAMALMDANRHDEARALLAEGEALFPGEVTFPANRGMLESRVGNWAAAADGWGAAVPFFNCPWWAVTEQAAALEMQGKFDEARDVLLRGCADPRFQAIPVYRRAAENAVKRRDWPDVAERLAAMADAFPDGEVLAQDLDRLLVPLRHADPTVFQSVMQAPWVGCLIVSDQADGNLLLAQARLAQLAGRNVEAMARIASVLPIMPQTVDAYMRLEETLFESGHHDDAGKTFAEAKIRLPKEQALWIRIASVKEQRGDWNGAIAEWIEFGKRFEQPELSAHHVHAASLRLRADEPQAPPREPYQAPTAPVPEAMKELALAFESLGGSGLAGGCEFGGVQRNWGAEPLGLFRWARVTPEILLACLEQRFEGIGEAENTELYQSDESTFLRWEIRDTRYGYEMHTFVDVDTMPHDRMVATARNRMLYLRRKLLDDLENPSKIFVLKTTTHHLTADEITRFGQAMSQWPQAQILCVQPYDNEHPPNHVEQLAPGLLAGYMDFLLDGHNWGPRTDAWEALCRKTLQQFGRIRTPEATEA